MKTFIIVTPSGSVFQLKAKRVEYTAGSFSVGSCIKLFDDTDAIIAEFNNISGYYELEFKA